MVIADLEKGGLGREEGRAREVRGAKLVKEEINVPNWHSNSFSALCVIFKFS
jgi:hypothetical protein